MADITKVIKAVCTRAPGADASEKAKAKANCEANVLKTEVVADCIMPVRTTQRSAVRCVHNRLPGAALFADPPPVPTVKSVLQRIDAATSAVDFANISDNELKLITAAEIAKMNPVERGILAKLPNSGGESARIVADLAAAQGGGGGGSSSSILRHFDDNAKAQRTFTNSPVIRLDPSTLTPRQLEDFKKQTEAKDYLTWANVQKIGDTTSDDQRGEGDVAKDIFSGVNDAIAKTPDNKRNREYARIGDIVAGAFQGNGRCYLGVDAATAQTMRLSPSSLDQLKSGNALADASFSNDFKPVRRTAYLGEKIGAGLIPVLGCEGRRDSWRWGALSLFAGGQVSVAEYSVHRDDYQRTDAKSFMEWNFKAHATGMYDLAQGPYGVLRLGGRAQAGLKVRGGDNFSGTPLGLSFTMDDKTYEKYVPTATGQLLFEYQPFKNFAIQLTVDGETTFEQEKQYKMSPGSDTPESNVGIQGKTEDEGIRNRLMYGLKLVVPW